MSTVDDVIEAGARAMSHHWRDMHTNESLGRQRQLSVHAASAMWPVLSAGLRELHVEREWRPLDGTCLGGTVCNHCRRDWPCATVRELDRIDRELGIETDNQSGDLGEAGREGPNLPRYGSSNRPALPCSPPAITPLPPHSVDDQPGDPSC